MAAVQTCHWHPDRETRLTCSRCGKPICVECMRQHPVGIRCKECAKVSLLPVYQLSTKYLLRGVAALVGLGMAGGVVLFIMDRIPGLGFFSLLIMLGIGYGAGEGISAAVNRRRGRPYQLMAAGAVVLALAVSFGGTLVLNGFLPRIGLFTVVGAVIAVVAATARLRP